ncbi:MAG: L,D-transpeptidase family protein [Flavisolibacter sp.]
MKTAFLISCLVAGGSLMMKNTDTEFKAAKSLPADKSSTSKRNISSNSLPKSPVRIVVDKSSYELYVYDAEGWYATYPVVFGNNTLDDKKMEGDKNTPEGTFKIVNKRLHEKWDRYMGLDYPTKESLAKFNERKKRGEVPKHASPGGGIGIHGTWPKDDYFIDKYKNWTNGCISLKNDDIEDLYSYIPIGTPITIHK